MFDLTQLYGIPIDQLLNMDPALLEKPLQMMQSPQGMPPVQQGAVPGFDAMVNPQGPVNLPPNVQVPPPLIMAPIVDKSVQAAPPAAKPQLTADQMAKLAAGMQTPDTGQRLPSPGTPASGRNIGQMQRLGAGPQAQQMPMTLAQLLSGRR